MIVYGTLKNCKKSNNCIGVRVDGVQLELNKKIDNFGNISLCEGADIYLDFNESDYSDSGFLRSFRLKSADIFVNGDVVNISDNSRLMYEIIKNSKLTEIVTYQEEEICNPSMLGSLLFQIGDRELNIKTNRTLVITDY